jgi:hypothetical protein
MTASRECGHAVPVVALALSALELLFAAGHGLVRDVPAGMP